MCSPFRMVDALSGILFAGKRRGIAIGTCFCKRFHLIKRELYTKVPKTGTILALHTGN